VCSVQCAVQFLRIRLTSFVEKCRNFVLASLRLGY
jgi:hypothetical protein